MQIQQFFIDKATNVIVEAIAEDKIRQFWANQGRRVSVYENPAQDLAGRQAYDRKDSLGYLWEIKNDIRCWHTGNVFIEESVHRSQAHFYLIFAQGQCYIFNRKDLCELVERINSTRHGGDDMRAIGTVVPLAELISLALNV
jgi:hypothetical protein